MLLLGYLLAALSPSLLFKPNPGSQFLLKGVFCVLFCFSSVSLSSLSFRAKPLAVCSHLFYSRLSFPLFSIAFCRASHTLSLSRQATRSSCSFVFVCFRCLCSVWLCVLESVPLLSFAFCLASHSLSLSLSRQATCSSCLDLSVSFSARISHPMLLPSPPFLHHHLLSGAMSLSGAKQPGWR
jgi:hypothetical protein